MIDGYGVSSGAFENKSRKAGHATSTVESFEVWPGTGSVQTTTGATAEQPVTRLQLVVSPVPMGKLSRPLGRKPPGQARSPWSSSSDRTHASVSFSCTVFWRRRAARFFQSTQSCSWSLRRDVRR